MNYVTLPKPITFIRDEPEQDDALKSIEDDIDAVAVGIEEGKVVSYLLKVGFVHGFLLVDTELPAVKSAK